MKPEQLARSRSKVILQFVPGLGLGAAELSITLRSLFLKLDVIRLLRKTGGTNAAARQAPA